MRLREAIKKQAHLRLCKLRPGTVFIFEVFLISKVIFIFEVFNFKVVFIFEVIILFRSSLFLKLSSFLGRLHF